jgi:hypothetical protein
MAAPGRLAASATFPAVKVRPAIVLALLLPLAVASGCGDDSPESNGVEAKSAKQIVADASAALSKVRHPVWLPPAMLARGRQPSG